MKRKETGTAGASPPSNSSVLRPPIPLSVSVAGLILFAFAATLALIGQYQRTLSLERAGTAREASTVIGAVEAGINVHVRPGARYLEERLQGYLDSLVETSPALAIGLVGEQDETFMAAGDGALLDGPTHWAEANVEAVWSPREGRARFQRRIQTMGASVHGAGRGPRGREQWASFPEGAYRVAVVMDTGDLSERIAAARNRLAASLAGLGAMTLLAALTLSLSARRRRLQEDLLRAEEQAAEHERLSRLGAGLAHETRNPLGVVRGLMQSIATDSSSSESMRGIAKDAIDEVDRTVGRINSFLQLARPVEPRPAPVNLDALLAEVTRLLATEASSGASLEHECRSANLTVEADADMLRRALFNLGLNALRAVGEEGKVRLETRLLPDDTVEVSVTDDGQGIDRQDLPRVTEPYFTRSEGGSGLGLAIVERISRAHGWSLRIDSEPGSGTRVYLCGMARVR